MPFNRVMSKFKSGLLHSGSSKGPEVKNRKQAIAIMLSEKKKADEGDEEYAASPSDTKTKKKKKAKINTTPPNFMKKFGANVS